MTAPLCFVDTETTSLRPDRRAWEIGLIRRDEDGQSEHRYFIDVGDLDLGNADPMSLRIGGFYDRHPAVQDGAGVTFRELYALPAVERITRGAHLIGNVVSFDAEVLANRMRANGICPSWHYHLIDIESMAVGYLWGKGVETPGEYPPLPWDSEWISEALGVDPPPENERHTALGDARWVMRQWDAITGGQR